MYCGIHVLPHSHASALVTTLSVESLCKNEDTLSLLKSMLCCRVLLVIESLFLMI